MHVLLPICWPLLSHSIRDGLWVSLAWLRVCDDHMHARVFVLNEIAQNKNCHTQFHGFWLCCGCWMLIGLASMLIDNRKTMLSPDTGEKKKNAHIANRRAYSRSKSTVSIDLISKFSRIATIDQNRRSSRSGTVIF